MTCTTLLRTGALAVAAIGLLAPSAAATPAAPISSIRSVAQNTCLDVSTTNPARYFLDTYGHACNGSAAQAFSFHPLTAGPPDTFEITSQATGQCLDQYRRGIRQEACIGAVPPDYTNAEWTLQQVGTTGHRYLFIETTTFGSTSPTCVQTYPTPNGYPGPLFDLTACDASQSAQIFTLGSTP